MCPNRGLISSKLNLKVKSAKPNLLLKEQRNLLFPSVIIMPTPGLSFTV